MTTKFYTTYNYDSGQRTMWEVGSKLSDRAKLWLENYLRDNGVNWWAKFLVNFTITKNALTNAHIELDSYNQAPAEFERLWRTRPMVGMFGFSLADHIADLKKGIAEKESEIEVYEEIKKEMDKINPLLIFVVDVD